MTNKSYNYIQKFSFWIFLPFLIFIILAVYSYLNQSRLVYKGHRLLNYPYSFYIPAIFGVLFLIYAVTKFSNWSKSKQNLAPIKLGDSVLSFPKGSSEIIHVNYIDINEIWVKDDEDGESIILYTENNKNRYEFFAESFDSNSKYIDFKTFLENKAN